MVALENFMMFTQHAFDCEIIQYISMIYAPSKSTPCAYLVSRRENFANSDYFHLSGKLLRGKGRS